MSEIVILAMCFQLMQLKKSNLKKNSGLNGTRTHDFAIPVQCYQATWIDSQLLVHLDGVWIDPCGLIAQWIEHCIGIERSWVRVPLKPEFFSGCFFNCLS